MWLRGTLALLPSTDAAPGVQIIKADYDVFWSPALMDFWPDTTVFGQQLYVVVDETVTKLKSVCKGALPGSAWGRRLPCLPPYLPPTPGLPCSSPRAACFPGPPALVSPACPCPQR